MKLFIVLIPIIFISCSPKYLIDSEEDKQNAKEYFEAEVQKYPISNGDTIVDIGSSYGYLAYYIFSYYPNCHFILEDISPNLDRYTKRAFIKSNGKKKLFKNNYSRIRGTASSIPLPNSMFDFILCRKTLHEFKNPNKMLSEMRRILSNKGILLIAEPIPKYEGELDSGCKKKLLTKSEVISLLTENGFEFINADSTTAFVDTLNNKRNLNLLQFSKK
jgi:ubiquinone/menaquinone biosynthesis C-methylase UbiE